MPRAFFYLLTTAIFVVSMVYGEPTTEALIIEDVHEPEPAKLLEEIDTIYHSSIAEGASNKFHSYQGSVYMLFNFPLAQWQVVSTLEDLMSFHQEYITSLEVICNENPEDAFCQRTKSQLDIFLQSYNSIKIRNCCTLLFFAISGMDVEENRKSLQNILVQYAVKQKIVRETYENSSFVLTVLAKEHLDNIRSFCAVSEDPSLKILFLELQGVDSLLGYWQKYRFVPPNVDEEAATLPVMQIQEAYAQFCTREEEFIEEYKEVIGL